MTKITSYAKLNEKYDLNFSDNNFGFTWEIFKELVTDEYASFFTTHCYNRWAPTARNALKTWNMIFFLCFLACNFNDVSTAVIRRYVKTHDTTSYSQFVNALEYLLNNYGIDLTPSNKNGIKWPDNVKNGGEIIFPNKVRIRFTGYENSSNIMGGAIAGNGFIGTWTDEIILPDEKELLSDEQLDGRYTRLQSSLLRSKLIKISYKKEKMDNGEFDYNLNKPIPIKEWSWTYFDRALNKEVTRYFVKSFFNIFTCNPYDKNHYFYKKYVTPFLPLNSKIMDLLKKYGNVWYENEEEFAEMGIFILRLTAKPNWDKLPAITKKLMLSNEKTNPTEFNIEYNGFEYSSVWDKLFPFRKAMKYVIPYNLMDFYDDNIKMYKFDFYTLGLDWATGPIDHSVLLFLGYKEIDNSGFYRPHIISEFVITPEQKLSEQEKINYFVEEILGIRDNFFNFDESCFYYDDHAKTAIDWIVTALEDNNGIKIKIKKAIKHQSSLNREAGLVNRVVWLRKVLANGFFANLNELPHLQECLEELRFDESKTNVPDTKMYQDPYDALFYSLYSVRWFLPPLEKSKNGC